ncbi:MAG: hypothetical protein AAFZ92_09275, partial [Pseudomonadota bacterium]
SMKLGMTDETPAHMFKPFFSCRSPRFQTKLVCTSSNNKVIAIDGCLSTIAGQNTLFLSDEAWLANDIAWQAQDYQHAKVLAGAILVAPDNKAIQTLGCPLLLSAAVAKTVAIDKPGRSAIAVEKQQEIAYWHWAWSHLARPREDKVDTIVVLSRQQDSSTETLSQAELLSKVWHLCIGRENIAVETLAHWLEGIQGYSVAVQNKGSTNKVGRDIIQNLVNCIGSEAALAIEYSE